MRNNQRFWTDAGRAARAADNDFGTIPLTRSQALGSPRAPRTISRRAVERIGGRPPSQPVKSPSE
jgi:hypothetical protein